MMQAGKAGADTPQLRGIFDDDEDPQYWKEAMENFPNKVPRFVSKDDYFAFIERVGFKPSNPEEPKLFHSISMLTTWKQIKTLMLPKYYEYNAKWEPKRADSICLENNKFVVVSNDTDVAQRRSLLAREYLLSRLDLCIHQKLSSISMENTLNYLFHHMRCGIFGMIRNNKLVMFCPFVNKSYRNTWNNCVRLDCPDNNVDTYYGIKHETTGRRENYLRDMSEWWANGNIICNEHQRIGEKEGETQWWGDSFNFQLKDMVAETCRTREVPDCDFFLNKRDYPQIKFHVDEDTPPDQKDAGITKGKAVEPYGFIFDQDDRDPSQDIPLAEHAYASYTPVLSFYTSSRFADIPFPSTEDWESATGEMFVNTMIPPPPPPGGGKPVISNPRELYTENNFRKFERPWSEKRETAFFRGSATGGGTTIDSNQRLHLALLGYNWEKEARGGSGKLSDGYVPHLDAKITRWNYRDKKVAGKDMTFIRTNEFPFSGGPENFTPIYEQSAFKYLIYAEGHCAACRYGFMMRLGSVILKVDSLCVADQMWYFPLLQPFYDHVPVKSDLSDLKEKIEWCRTHDAECKVIADNAMLVYDKYISKDGILDYMQLIFCEMSSRTVRPPQWARQQELPIPPFSLAHPSDDLMNTCCRVDGEQKLCAMCSEKKKIGVKRKREEVEQTAAADDEKAARQRRMRERMKLKAGLK